MLPTAKVVLLGAAGAGKTAFVDRVAKGVFNPRPACAGNSITAQFWDCAASSLDRSRKREFLEGAVTVILAYDISHKPSFDAILDSLYLEAQSLVPSAFFVLLGCKSDLGELRQVSVSEAREFASGKDVFLMECSAKEGTNIDLVTSILRIRSLGALRAKQESQMEVPSMFSGASTRDAQKSNLPIAWGASSDRQDTVSQGVSVAASMPSDTGGPRGTPDRHPSGPPGSAWLTPARFGSEAEARPVGTEAAPSRGEELSLDPVSKSYQTISSILGRSSGFTGGSPSNLDRLASRLLHMSNLANEAAYGSTETVEHSKDKRVPTHMHQRPGDSGAARHTAGEEEQEEEGNVRGGGTGGDSGPVSDEYEHLKNLLEATTNVAPMAAIDLGFDEGETHDSQWLEEPNGGDAYPTRQRFNNIQPEPYPVRPFHPSMDSATSHRSPPRGVPSQPHTHSPPEEFDSQFLKSLEAYERRSPSPSRYSSPPSSPQPPPNGRSAKTLSFNFGVPETGSNGFRYVGEQTPETTVAVEPSPPRAAKGIQSNSEDDGTQERQWKLSEYQKKRIIMYIDVKVKAGVVGQIAVKKGDNYFNLAHKFVRDNGLSPGLIVKLSKLIEARVKEWKELQKAKKTAEKREANLREMKRWRQRTTVPQPFSFASDHRKKLKHHGNPNVSNQPLLGKLVVEVGPGREASIPLRLGDDPKTLVKNFALAYGLQPGQGPELFAQVKQQLQRATEDYHRTQAELRRSRMAESQQSALESSTRTLPSTTRFVPADHEPITASVHGHHHNDADSRMKRPPQLQGFQERSAYPQPKPSPQPKYQTPHHAPEYPSVVRFGSPPEQKGMQVQQRAHMPSQQQPRPTPSHPSAGGQGSSPPSFPNADGSPGQVPVTSGIGRIREEQRHRGKDTSATAAASPPSSVARGAQGPPGPSDSRPRIPSSLFAAMTHSSPEQGMKPQQRSPARSEDSSASSQRELNPRQQALLEATLSPAASRRTAYDSPKIATAMPRTYEPPPQPQPQQEQPPRLQPKSQPQPPVSFPSSVASDDRSTPTASSAPDSRPHHSGPQPIAQRPTYTPKLRRRKDGARELSSVQKRALHGHEPEPEVAQPSSGRPTESDSFPGNPGAAPVQRTPFEQQQDDEEDNLLSESDIEQDALLLPHKSLPQVAFRLDVKLPGTDTTKRIVVCKGDSVTTLAEEFVKRHGLGKETVTKLKKLLKKNIQFHQQHHGKGARQFR